MPIEPGACERLRTDSDVWTDEPPSHGRPRNRSPVLAQREPDPLDVRQKRRHALSDRLESASGGPSARSGAVVADDGRAGGSSTLCRPHSRSSGQRRVAVQTVRLDAQRRLDKRLARDRRHVHVSPAPAAGEKRDRREEDEPARHCAVIIGQTRRMRRFAASRIAGAASVAALVCGCASATTKTAATKAPEPVSLTRMIGQLMLVRMQGRAAERELPVARSQRRDRRRRALCGQLWTGGAGGADCRIARNRSRWRTAAAPDRDRPGRRRRPPPPRCAVAGAASDDERQDRRSAGTCAPRRI